MQKEIILALFDLLSEIRGHTRLQKLLFLLQHEVEENLDLQFKPYLYGPYSAALSDVLDELKKENLIKEIKDIDDPNEKGFLYIINRDEKKMIEKYLMRINSSLSKKIKKIANKYGRMPINQLLKYVYLMYPDYTTKSIWKGNT
ncbi:MAG: hypothetical protein GF329_05660 [Candidatus Lokiarchaeota archaeon]|nr:hypothetical protein [Candidatus Lokiarchaeota archaeon]